MNYNGSDVFGVDFNLYGHEGIHFEATKEAIERDFVYMYEADLKKHLKTLGLKYEGLNFSSPREYNFMGDSLDLTVSITSPAKLKQAIKDNKKEIQQLLYENKSYDGYMAQTKNTIIEVLREVDAGELDIIALQVLLKPLDFKDFDIYDNFDTCDFDDDDDEKYCTIKTCPDAD